MVRSIMKRSKSCKGHRSPVSRKTSCRSSTNFSPGNYSRYINRVLKDAAPKKMIASHTLNIMNILLNDLFDRIVMEASHLMHSRNDRTLAPEDIQQAVYRLLPGKLAEKAMTFGNEAVHRFVSS